MASAASSLTKNISALPDPSKPHDAVLRGRIRYGLAAPAQPDQAGDLPASEHADNTDLGHAIGFWVANGADVRVWDDDGETYFSSASLHDPRAAIDIGSSAERR